MRLLFIIWVLVITLRDADCSGCPAKMILDKSLHGKHKVSVVDDKQIKILLEKIKLIDPNKSIQQEISSDPNIYAPEVDDSGRTIINIGD